MSLTNRDIYKNALSLIGERISGSVSDDYEERAEYILPAFFCVAKNTDKKLRKIEGLDDQPSFNPVHTPLDSEFPLSDSFVSTAALYLAAMLVIDENSELSDTLYDKYCDSIASIAASLSVVAEESSASCEPIVQKYFFD